MAKNSRKMHLLDRGMKSALLMIVIGVVYWAERMSALSSGLTTPETLQAHPETEWLDFMTGRDIVDLTLTVREDFPLTGRATLLSSVGPTTGSSRFMIPFPRKNPDAE